QRSHSCEHEVALLLSMTGFGEASFQELPLAVSAEVRAVNNRHFKLICRISDPYDALEPEIERMVRGIARRGTIQVALRVERPKRPEDYRLNLVALRSYRDQLDSIQRGDDRFSIASLLALPGVVEDHHADDAHPHSDWPVVERVLEDALKRFQDSRAQEGRAMAKELLTSGRVLADELERVAARVPEVVAGYQQR